MLMLDLYAHIRSRMVKKFPEGSTDLTEVMEHIAEGIAACGKVQEADPEDGQDSSSAGRPGVA